MEGVARDVLYVRGDLQDKSKRKSPWGRFKSPKQSSRKCWKCDQARHYVMDCRSKTVDKSNGYDDAFSTKVKSSIEGGDVYLESTSTHDSS